MKGVHTFVCKLPSISSGPATDRVSALQSAAEPDRQTGRARQAEPDGQSQTDRARQAQRNKQSQTGRARQAQPDRQSETGTAIQIERDRHIQTGSAVERETDEEDLTPFSDAPDEPEEPELGSPRQPLESVESVDSPGTHTLPHTVPTRTVYQIISNDRCRNQQSWQLRACINCSGGDLLVNTTMSVSTLLPIPQQEAMANFTSTP